MTCESGCESGVTVPPIGDAQLLLDLGRKAVPIGVVQPDLERLQPPQRRRADAACRDSADLHAKPEHLELSVQALDRLASKAIEHYA